MCIEERLDRIAQLLKQLKSDAKFHREGRHKKVSYYLMLDDCCKLIREIDRFKTDFMENQ